MESFIVSMYSRDTNSPQTQFWVIFRIGTNT